MLSNGNSQYANRIIDACDKLFRLGSATRGQLTAEQRQRPNAMTLKEPGSMPGFRFLALTASLKE